MPKTHGWDKPSPFEEPDSKPIEVLAASSTEELFTRGWPVPTYTERPFIVATLSV
jgi:hypothetical protein